MPAPARISELGRWQLRYFAVLESTNGYLLDVARDGAPDRLVAVADFQTAGRGRLDRRWDAPAGSSLLVSALLRSPADPSRAVMAAGVALALAIGEVAGVSAALKWPNDLVVGDRKLAGLLAEREGDVLVVGAGVNVNWESFPPELAAAATACNVEAGRAVDRDALLSAYLMRYAGLLEGGMFEGGQAIVDAYRDRLVTLGRRVRVERVAGPAVAGTAVAVGDDGALTVRDDDGGEHVVTAGDVVHLRPA